MDRDRINSIIWLMAYALLVGIAYLLVRAGGELAYPPGLIAWIYATIIIAILLVVQRISTIFVQHTATPWVLGMWSIIYLAAFLYAVLFILILHYFLIIPGGQLGEEIFTRIIAVLSTIFSALAEGKRPPVLTLDWLMTQLTPVLAILALVVLFALFLALLISYIEILQKNRQLQEAQLRVLQSQMEPHFLFNALNTIAAEIPVRPHKAEQLVIGLAEFFRTIFKEIGQQRVPLEREIAMVQHYLEIQQARFGDKLKFTIEVQPDCLTFQVPPLILQPVVENAIKHGWCDRTAPLEIHIHCQIQGSDLQIVVEDSGCGISESIIKELPTGHSLHNVQQRLTSMYGRKAGVTLTTGKEGGTRVTLHIPMNSRGAYE